MLKVWFSICTLVRNMWVMCLGWLITTLKNRIVLFLRNLYEIYSKLLIAILKNRNFFFFSFWEIYIKFIWGYWSEKWINSTFHTPQFLAATNNFQRTNSRHYNVELHPIQCWKSQFIFSFIHFYWRITRAFPKITFKWHIIVPEK